jgi:Flp pilus assembly protein TadG
MWARRSNGVRRSGSSIIETAAGLLVLVPVVLFLFDLVSLIMVQTANDSLAKHAARAAAEIPDPDPTNAGAYAAVRQQAQNAAQNIVNAFPSSRLATNPTLLICDYQDNRTTGVSQVYVRTRLSCVLPIPIPFVGTAGIDFDAEATEPIVAVLPP